MQAAFVDLKPLLDYYRRMYFGTRAAGSTCEHFYDALTSAE